MGSQTTFEHWSEVQEHILRHPQSQWKGHSQAQSQAIHCLSIEDPKTIPGSIFYFIRIEDPGIILGHVFVKLEHPRIIPGNTLTSDQGS